MKGAPSFSPLQKSASIVSAVGGGIKCIHIAGNRNRRSEKSRKTDLGKEYSLGQTPVIEVLLKFLLVDCQTDCGTLRKHLTKHLEQVAAPDCKRDDFEPATHSRKGGTKGERESLARPPARAISTRQKGSLASRPRPRPTFMENQWKERERRERSGAEEK